MKISELITALQKLSLSTTLADADVWIDVADDDPRELHSVESADFGHAALILIGKRVGFYTIPSTPATRRQG